MFFPSAGVETNPFMLIAIGFAVGVCSSFFGFGGGFIITPALNILGFPMPFAIATSMAQTSGIGVLSSLRHRKLGNLDLRLGVLMVAGTVTGVELGKRLVLYLEALGNVDMVVRWIYIALLGGLGLFMLNEVRKANARRTASLLGKSPSSDVEGGLGARIRRLNCPPFVSLKVSGIPKISVWIPLILIGVTTGVLAGLLGAGGGFIRVPALIYLMGVPTVIAVATDLFEVVISGSYGTFTYALAHRVELLAIVLMLIGASAGVQIGAMATRYVHADRIRYCFAVTILLTAVSVLLDQAGAITGLKYLGVVSITLLLLVAGGMSALIIFLFIKNRAAALRASRAQDAAGKLVPDEETAGAGQS